MLMLALGGPLSGEWVDADPSVGPVRAMERTTPAA